VSLAVVGTATGGTLKRVPNNRDELGRGMSLLNLFQHQVVIWLYIRGIPLAACQTLTTSMIPFLDLILYTILQGLRTISLIQGSPNSGTMRPASGKSIRCSTLRKTLFTKRIDASGRESAIIRCNFLKVQTC